MPRTSRSAAPAGSGKHQALAREALNRPDRPIEDVQRDLNARLAELEQMRGQISAKEREINLLLMELSKLHMKEKRKTVLRARKSGA